MNNKSQNLNITATEVKRDALNLRESKSVKSL